MFNMFSHFANQKMYIFDLLKIVKYGFIPEFVGRIPVIASAKALREQDLVRILTEPRNSLINQFKLIFKQSGIDLVFKKDALRKIAELASQKNTGARGLRRVLESSLQTALYEFPGSDVKTVIVQAENIENPEIPLVTFRLEEAREAEEAAAEPEQNEVVEKSHDNIVAK